MAMIVSSILEVLQPEVVRMDVPDAQVGELCIDSRKVVRPETTLFFAIQTERNDGHRYISQLLAQGVRNFVVTHPVELGDAYKCNVFQMPNAVDALQQLVAHHRRRFSYPVIGITGSNGKTIVKEWLSLMMEDSFNVVKSPDSFNSQIGVPLSVWRMDDHHDMAIFEAGISKPGEMQRIAEVIQPTAGILTNIGMAHAQFFSANREKIVEKLKLFRSASMLIYRDDNAEVQNILQDSEYNHLNKISWGSGAATYPVTMENNGGSTCIRIAENLFNVPFRDAASLENVTHAIVLLLQLGVAPEVINRRISMLSQVGMRMEIIEGCNHSVIINDTYSLDLNSLGAALDFMGTQTQLEKRTLILSDFEQVGTLAERDYLSIAQLLRQHHIQRLIAVGSHLTDFRHCFAAFDAQFYDTTDDLLEDLPGFSYETILVKGARNFHFERIVHRLRHKTHLTILNVSLPAIAYNLNLHRRLLKPETKVVAMVKATSYGLGDAELINELVTQHIDYLAVAYTDEGVRLRKRHIQTPIIVLGAEAHSFDVMVRHHLEPEIFNFYYLQELIKVLQHYPQIQLFNIHIKLDTGMHRLGFDEADLPRLIQIVKEHPQLHIASVFSHLCAAEDPAEDTYTMQQITLFKRMTDSLCAAFDYRILRHILNSAGIFRFTDAQFDMVRLGISLYGSSEIPEVAAQLHNVATLKTVVTQVKHFSAGESIGYNRSFVLQRDSQVAIIPIGYADGYPRELSNGKGTVIIQGQRVPIIGKVCMDMCMVDVTGLTVHEGDEVIVYGEGNSVSDMARAAGLISYELTTRLSPRVPRVYVRE